MRFGICSIILPDLLPQEAIECAAAAGFAGIEWRIGTPAASTGPWHFWKNNRATIAPDAIARELPQLKTLAEQHGLDTPAISPYYTCLEPAPIESVMAAMQTAGVANLRVTSPNYDARRDYNAQFSAARSGFANVEKLARTYGVRACLEQHQGSLTPSASACARMIDGLDPRHIGVIMDPGNTVVEGYENFAIAIELLGPYLAEIHIKSAVRQPPTKVGDKWEVQWHSLHTGMVDLAELRQAIQKTAWSGWLMLEDFSDRPRDLRLSEGLAVMRSLARP